MSDKVAIVGAGGREHALATSIGESTLVDTIYTFDAPWSAITPKCVDLGKKSLTGIVDVAEEKAVDLIVPGPEQFLIDGMADIALYRNMRIFGTESVGAELEGNKAAAKEFMKIAGVPTAPYKTFRHPRKAVEYLRGEWAGPVYVKASGPAQGKGALPGRTKEEAIDAVERIMVRREFGNAGMEIVIEEFLPGQEATCVAYMNSRYNVIMPELPSEDHKKLKDNDQGPNTGGMGAFAPTSLVTGKIAERIYYQILQRTAQELQHRGEDYIGSIYPGLMIDEGKVRVVEFNIRKGDPETQPTSVLADYDVYLCMQNVIDGNRSELRWKPGYAVCVVLAANGYPKSPGKGMVIHGLDKEYDDVKVFYAGVRNEEGSWKTDGGRVLGVTGYGETITSAIASAYGAIGCENGGIWFEGMQFRHDIGHKEVLRRAA